MKTTATNRKVRELLTALRDGRLDPRPEFQRRLVWSNTDRVAFIETVLLGYPFPEVYVAAGEVDLESGEAKELLVDGQQRLTTLNQYFTGSPDIRLPETLRPYVDLSAGEKEKFLQYDVVVRDLGKLSIDAIREVFKRINATRYALNAMEIHNARYAGKFKEFAEELAQDEFFERHRVFRPADTRRMLDTLFVLQIVTTVMSTYFHRDSEIETFLKRYNDDFPAAPVVSEQLKTVFTFIDDMNLLADSRAWQKTDLFTLIVEVYRARYQAPIDVAPKALTVPLQTFYDLVERAGHPGDRMDIDRALSVKAAMYYLAALQASNDRSSRIERGNAIRYVIEQAHAAPRLDS